MWCGDAGGGRLMRTRDLLPEVRLLIGSGCVLLIMLAVRAFVWERLTGTEAPWLQRPR